MRQAMMIDYEFCTGCHSCETACKKEKGLEKGQFGIKLFENGPWKIDEKHWQYDFIPAPTRVCDLCAERTEAGKMAMCVQHCQADVITIGPLDELEKLATKDNLVIYVR